MKRRKTKLWKKLLVGFMSFNMFLGNLQALSIEAFAAEVDHDEEYAEEEGGVFLGDSFEDYGFTAGTGEDYSESDESVVYNVSFYDTEGNEISTEEYTKGAYLQLPALEGDISWVDSNGYSYYDSTQVISDLSLFAINNNIDSSESVDSSEAASDDTSVSEEDMTAAVPAEDIEYKYGLSAHFTNTDGDVIPGYEEAELPRFTGFLSLSDVKNPPVVIEDYDYVEARIGNTVVTALNADKNGEITELTAGSEVYNVDTDIELTLVYKSVYAAVELKGTVVDEFGDPVGNDYIDMDLPGFNEDGILILDDEELPPVEKVKTRAGLFRSVSYTYVKTTLNGTTIKALKGEEAKNGVDTYYSYTVDGETWIPITENGTVYFEYTDGRKSVYTYEDSRVSVKATLQHANAVPDDAYFAVTPVINGSAYDVDTYIDALNKKASNDSVPEGFEYTTDNTLLYDIAFYTDESRTEEIQPAEGMVKIEINFLNNQLKEDIAASGDSNMVVNHMSVSESKLEEAGTLADVNVSVKDIRVESVDANVSVTGENVEFSTGNFSIFTITDTSSSFVIEISFQRADGSSDNAPVLAREFLYLTDNSGKKALVRLDGSQAQNGVIELTTESISDSEFSFSNFTPSESTVEFLQALNKDVADTTSLNGNIKNRDFWNSKMKLLNPDEDLIGMYRFTMPNKDSNGKYSIVNGKLSINAKLSDAGSGGLIYKSVLGNAVNFGITANEYYQENDAETNFATKLDSGNAGQIGGDLSNNTGSYYIGSVTNKLLIKDGKSDFNIFAPAEYEFSQEKENQGQGYKLKYTSKGHFYPTSKNDVDAYVKSLIDGVTAPAGTALKLPMSGWQDDKVLLDLKAFDDNAVIHIDLDDATNSDGRTIGDVIQINGRLYINKKQNQTIVFHSTRSSVGISKFMVCNDGSYSNWIGSDTQTASVIEPIAKSIIFDFTSSNVSYVSMVDNGSICGIILAPHATVEWWNTSSGWIVADVAKGHQGEWHNVYQEMPPYTPPTNDSGTGTIKITKRLQGKDSAENVKYLFKMFGQDSTRYSVGELHANITFTSSKNRNVDYTKTEENINGTDREVFYFELYADETITIAGLPIIPRGIDSNGKEVSNDFYIQEVKAQTDADEVYVESLVNFVSDTSNVANFALSQRTQNITIYPDSSITYVNVYYSTLTIEKNIIGYEKPLTDAQKNQIRFTVTGPDGFNQTVSYSQFTDNKFTFGKEYKLKRGEYTVTESGADIDKNYTYTTTISNNGKVTIDAANPGTVTVTNTYTEAPTEATVKKVWDDSDDQDGKRPTELKVTLNNGTEVFLNEFNNWTATVGNLPKYDNNGDEIIYTWSEPSMPAGYTLTNTEKNGTVTTLTNSYNTKKTSASVEKVWNDDSNRDGIRPDGVEVALYNGVDNDPVKTVTLNAGNNWSHTESDLPVNKARTKLTYTWKELNTPSEYTKAETVNGTLTTITNTHTIESTSVSVNKVWNDSNDQDGMRPDNISVRLLANGESAVHTNGTAVSNIELTSTGNWSGSFTNLPKKAGGTDITYTIEEVGTTNEKFTVTKNGRTKEYTVSINGFTITNSCETEKTSISGSKTWNDNNDQDGVRPDSITINLLANGTKVDSQPVSADNEGKWNWSFENLPKYSNGIKIAYSITEDPVANYTSEVSGYNVTNTHETEKTSIKVTKTWDDNNDQDGVRPPSVTLQLCADGEEVEGKTAELSSSNAKSENIWEYTFTGLDKKTNNGTGSRLIEYTVKEVTIPNDYAIIGGENGSGKNITNYHKPETKKLTITKNWINNSNTAGLNHDSITVNLWKSVNGSDRVQVGEPIIMNGTGNTWTYTTEELPVKENGQDITYTVTEESVSHYKTEINGLTINNTYETISVNGTKIWNDAKNQDGKRPDSVNVKLTASTGEIYSQIVKGDKKADSWNWSFADLPKYANANGDLVTYTVSEDPVEGYTTAYDGNTITNSYTPGKTSVTTTKTWVDGDNQDGIRPAKINVALVKTYTDDENATHETNVESVEITAAKDGTWSYKWPELPDHEDGYPVTYSVREDTVTGYTTTYEGTNITNTHTPEVTEVTVTKEWDDDDNRDVVRPSSVTVVLNGDDGSSREATIAPDSNGVWSYTFTGLPKFNNSTTPIEYTVSEKDVDKNYTSEVDNESLKITNKHDTAKVSVSGTKIWDDDNNNDGYRPDQIKVKLLADGTETGKTVTLPGEDGWNYSFEGLNKFRKGENGAVLINYTVSEEIVWNENNSGKYLAPVYDYSKDNNGNVTCTITNKHTPDTMEFTVTKTWSDDNNRDNKRPASIVFTLYADGAAVLDNAGNKVTATLTDNATAENPNVWSYTFTGLAKFKRVDNETKEIKYSVREETVPAGYEITTTTDTNIINNHAPETVKFNITKNWNDNGNEAGRRPENMTVILTGKVGDSTVSTDEYSFSGTKETDVWTFETPELPKYNNKSLISYTLTESEPGNSYRQVGDVSYTEKSGFVLTNEYVPEYVTISGTKVWNDESNFDGSRPQSVRIIVNRGTENVAEQIVSRGSDADSWDWTFGTDYKLPKYDNGELVEYTVVEDTTGLAGIYQTSYDNATQKASADSSAITGMTITNTYEPGKTTVSVTKIWNDGENRDGFRPTSIQVQLHKYVGGVEKTNEAKTVELNAGNNWTTAWSGLALKENNKTVTYTVTEDTALHAGYTSSITHTGDAWTIENSYIPETISVSGGKDWDDANNQDGARPESITILLYKNKTSDGDRSSDENNTSDGNETSNGDETSDENNTSDGNETSGENNTSDGNETSNGGELVASVKTNANEGWAWSFTDLYKYENGKPVNYTVEEASVSPYRLTATTEGTTDANGNRSGIIFTNSYTPSTTYLEGSKTWNDNNDQDGKRPGSITIQLLANGNIVTGKTLKVTDEDGWKWIFTDLPRKSNGQEIKYTVSETPVSGYETAYSENGANVTNTHTPETITVSGTKTWLDNDDQDGKRPESITVHLFAGGTEVANKVVTAGDDWKYTFTGLPKYASGTEITYTVTEDTVSGYTTEYSGFDIINKHTPEKISINGSKTWNDADDQDGKRPNTVTIKLLKNGEEFKTASISEFNDWKWNFDDLDRYEDGRGIAYTVVESPVDENYTVNPENGFVATTSDGNIEKLKDLVFVNTHTPEKVTIEGTKVWNDADDQDNKRPESVTINLLANGEKVNSITLKEETGWDWKFENLDKYSEKNEITYSISEESVEGYTPDYSYDKDTDKWTITNSYTPGETYVSGVKVWKDNEDQDKIRPESITVKLLADGKYLNSTTASESDGWTWRFDNLPINKAGAKGQKINYTIEEVSVNGYTTEIAKAEGKDNEYVITNYHTPAEISISGKKEWSDNNDQDGIRPTSIDITLSSDLEGFENQVFTAVAPDYEWSFTNLPKLNKGKKINYTVTEDLKTAGYVFDEKASNLIGSPDTVGNVSGITFVNKHEPEKIEIGGIKTWNDANNRDNKRPAEITLDLYSDKSADTTVPVKTINVKANEKGEWKWSFGQVDKYSGGQVITYTVKERLVEDSVYTVSPESVTVTGESDTNITIENSYTPETINIYGSKYWDDNNDQDGIRPESIDVILRERGTNGQIDKKTVTAEDDWKWSFTDLPRRRSGAVIQYEVVEAPLAEDSGYTFEGASTENITENGKVITFSDIVFTNKHVSSTVNVSGTKTWVDNDDQDGSRPASITVRLYANGEEIKNTTVSADEKGDWKYSFDDLPEKESGETIVYTITEDEVLSANGSDKAYVSSIDGYNITNTYETETTSVSVKKIWDDADDQDGKRPESVSVQLTKNGKPYGEAVELDSENLWSHTFSNLPKYEAGTAIEYGVTEAAVEDYSTKIDGNMSAGYTITNSYTPGKTAVSVKKIWDDADDQDGKRPSSINVILAADGKAKQTAELSAANDWNYTFEDLDLYSSGNPISYSVTEDSKDLPDGYKPGAPVKVVDNSNAWSITNTYVPETTFVSGSKTWKDSGDQDGVRPESITVRLLADGKEIESRTVTAADKWAWTFDDLPKYADGHEIVYTITEDQIPAKEGFKAYIQTVDGYNAINSYEPETVLIEGSKSWNDDDDQDGVRPDKITVTLRGSDGSVISKDVTAENGWKWSFGNLPRYKDGVEVKYTLEETPILLSDGTKAYDAQVTGYDIINTHESEKVNVRITKKWNDEGDRDGIRPDSVTVQLYADGETKGSPVVLSYPDWTYTFTGLDKYADGKLIQYTVEEKSVEGYEASYTGAGSYNLVVTNTHTPEYVTLTINKKWIGRAASDSIGVKIEGKLPNGSTAFGPVEKTITAASDWTLKLTEADKLPKYADRGQLVTYYVTEAASEDGSYIQTDAAGKRITGSVTATGTDSLEAVLINIPMTKLTVTKNWLNDLGYHGNTDNIDVLLMADGRQYRDALIKASDNWTYTFENLPEYNADGSKVEYKVVENSSFTKLGYKAPAYDYSQAGNVIITNEMTTLTLNIEKQWLADNPANRPSSIDINVLTSVQTEQTATSVFTRIKKALGIDSDSWYSYKTVTLTAANDWKATLDNLPRYAKVGNSVVEVGYAVAEVNVPDGYTSVANIDNGNAVIINTGNTSVAGFKTWDDNGNAAGYRPGSAEFASVIQLYQDGNKYLTGSDSKHFRWLDTTGDSWSFEFYDLPVGYTYTIGEIGVIPGYGEGVVDSSTNTIKNPLKYTELKVTKVWDDENNAYLTRPDTISFRLLANGSQASISGLSPIITIGNQSGASYTWKNLPMLDTKGKAITYSVEEVSVPSGYSSTMTGGGTAYTITNRFRPDDTSINVTKIWDDQNDAAGLRPRSIQVALTRNGTDIDTVTLSSSNNWSYAWSDLPTMLPDGTGSRAQYSVREITQILGYSVTVSGSGTSYTITNYYRAPGGDTPTPTPTPTPGTPTPTPGPGGDTPTPTPGGGNPTPDEPTNTTPTPEPYTIPDEPTPLAGVSQVLGARRAAAGSVLGARRSPATGDQSNAAAFAAAMATAGAMMGAWFAMRKKKKS